jgi:hypothetical protein
MSLICKLFGHDEKEVYRRHAPNIFITFHWYECKRCKKKNLHSFSLHPIHGGWNKNKRKWTDKWVEGTSPKEDAEIYGPNGKLHDTTFQSWRFI